MSGEKKPGRDWSPWLYRGAGAVSLFGVWALDTFTVQGFLSAFYLAPTTDGMWWPTGTRAVWWFLFYVVGTAFVQRLMWREGVLTFTGHFQMWAASHVSAAKRLTRRFRWWAAGISSAFAQARAAAERTAAAERDVSIPVSGTIPDTRTPETVAA